jgi:hypothetical protein
MSNAHVHPVIQEALAPFAPPQRQSLSLYEIEQEFQQLLEQDAAEPPTPEEDSAFVARLQQMVECDERRAIKRDRCAQFRRHLDLIAGTDKIKGTIDLEIDRLRNLKASYVTARERFNDYLARCMNAIGVKRLEGNTSVISLKKNPPSLPDENIDLDQLPSEYVRVTVTMPAIMWSTMMLRWYSMSEPTTADRLQDEPINIPVDMHPDKAAIKAALLAGEQVSGARLVTDRQSVQVR